MLLGGLDMSPPLPLLDNEYPCLTTDDMSRMV